jgi:hypothetical protein
VCERERERERENREREEKRERERREREREEREREEREGEEREGEEREREREDGMAEQPRMGCKTFPFFSPVQTGLPRELAKSLTRATQPGLVSPGGGEQAQRHHPASLSSESGESLRHVGCYSAKGVWGSRP